MWPEDTPGNTQSLDRWRAEIGLSYGADIELHANTLKVPIP